MSVCRVEIVEPGPDACSAPPPPEGNVKVLNYRMLNNTLRAYTPTGDVHTSPAKGKLVPRFDVCSAISPPRARILELVRPGDPGREALEEIVRAAPRRLARPLDEDARRFLQRALMSPSPQGLSAAPTPEPITDAQETCETVAEREQSPTETVERASGERSLADELREAEEEERTGVKRDLFRERAGEAVEAVERERLGRLALSVEEEEEASLEEEGLGAAARRLDALLAEARALHGELAAVHRDLQVSCARASRCAAAARALAAESCALRYLDDVVALLRGDLAGARRARHWPFAGGARAPGRNYIV